MTTSEILKAIENIKLDLPGSYRVDVMVDDLSELYLTIKKLKEDKAKLEAKLDKANDAIDTLRMVAKVINRPKLEAYRVQSVSLED